MSKCVVEFRDLPDGHTIGENEHLHRFCSRAPYDRRISAVSTDDKKPIARPSIVLREEFDDWAVLFDPDTGDAFGLNPVGVFVWKHLDGKHSVDEIVAKLREECENVPDAAADEVRDFAQKLVERGYAGYKVEGVR